MRSDLHAQRVSPRFVAEIEPVLRTDIYGYHPFPRVFLKVYTYDPRSVARIATIVSQRGLPEDLLPPSPAAYEAHIPFHMQFLIDHNLSGMAYVNLEQCRFRPPLPEARGADAAALFARPNAERRFVAGLEKDRWDLFWPFHVAKRARSELELDSFAQHILNAREETQQGEYAFVSRTLRLLWEEERLRTGCYPERQRNPERVVKAGGHLSEEALRDRLQEVVDADRKVADGGRGDDDMRDVAGFFGTQTQDAGSEFLPATYDDVLKVLDATGSFETLEDDLEIEEFEEQKAVGDVDIFNDDRPLGGDGVQDWNSDPHVIQKDWADIADCTQLVSNGDDEKTAQQAELAESRRQRSPPRKMDQNKDQPPQELEEDIEDDVESSPGSLERKHCKTTSSPEVQQLSTPEDVSIAEERLMQTSDPLDSKSDRVVAMHENISSPEHAMPEQLEAIVTHRKSLVEDASTKGDLSACDIVHPAERPPSCTDVVKQRHVGDAMSITYATPFYGEKEDEGQSRQPFGGMIIPVRGSGADGYPPFPSFFRNQKTAVEILPRVLRPAERPPSISQLKSALVDTNGVAGNTGKRTRFVIDSAGRQVHQRSQGTVRDPLTFSSDPTVDFLPHRPRTGHLSKSHDQESESSDDSECETPRLEPIQRTDTFHDDDENFVQNRPLSPKYDEGFQLFVNPSRHGKFEQRRETFSNIDYSHSH